MRSLHLARIASLGGCTPGARASGQARGNDAQDFQLQRIRPGSKSILAAMVAFAIGLPGCSTAPVLTWQKEASSSDSGASMPEALGFLDRGRNTYRSAVADQMRAEANLANGLLGAGALITALAAADVHRSVILGTTLVAGTAYGAGSFNLKRQRVHAYLAGIDALNCSERAVLPFAISAKELASLVAAIDDLDGSRRELINAINAAKTLSDSRKKAHGLNSPAIDATLPDAELAQQTADTTIKAGRQYTASASRAARELVAAVNRIDAAVVRAQIDATPDLSALPGLISGLAGMAGSFAPGSGIEALVGDSLKKSISARSRAGDETEAMAAAAADAHDKLQRAMQDTARKNATASALLAGRAVPWAEDAFKDCGVTQIVAPLAVVPASLTFTAGMDGKRLVDISGGVKPFFVEIDGTSIDGLTVKSPVRFDSRAEVSIVGRKVANPFQTTLRITDSSPNARFVSLPLSVVAGPETPLPAEEQLARVEQMQRQGKPVSLDAAVALLKRKGNFTFSGASFSIVENPSKASDGLVNVKIRCPAGDARFKSADLAKKLLADIGITAVPPARTWDVGFVPIDKNCLAD
ncbi:hypothetical protein [Paracidovorax oryzae]|uniref:hypothetical protein n=1 Tax=Paracidovorax oryzae TaxID=862720 RepID=UPI000303F918|nr:hypothetical protein [Paracidovorax oryzae]